VEWKEDSEWSESGREEAGTSVMTAGDFEAREPFDTSVDMSFVAMVVTALVYCMGYM